jgi:hypothetical protein
MWIEATRFDESFMQGSLASDFFEIGSSGRVHSRAAVLSATRQVIGMVLPLRELAVRLLDENTAHVTYISETENAGGGRSVRAGARYGPRPRMGGSCDFTRARPSRRSRMLSQRKLGRVLLMDD